MKASKKAGEWTLVEFPEFIPRTFSLAPFAWDMEKAGFLLKFGKGYLLTQPALKRIIEKYHVKKSTEGKNGN